MPHIINLFNIICTDYILQAKSQIWLQFETTFWGIFLAFWGKVALRRG